MNRRDFLRLGLAASALALGPAAAAPRAASSGALAKRGLCIAARKDPLWREKLRALGVRWFYTWAAQPPEEIPAGLEFVPMIFRGLGEAQFADAAATIRASGAKHLLGFNEPDAASQGDLSVEDALALWPRLMDLGLPLVSPGCVHPDKDWMNAFMQGVKSRGLRVDFVAVHSYGGPSADGLMKRLEAARKLHGRRLWLTEFGVGDWKAKTPAENRFSPDTVRAFLEEALPRLDRCEFVARYAWFPAGKANPALGPCALFEEDGSLTPLGRTYRLG